MKFINKIIKAFFNKIKNILIKKKKKKEKNPDQNDIYPLW